MSSPRLVVGAPIYRREWCLPYWFAYVASACREAGFDNWGYVFVVPESDPSVPILWEESGSRDVDIVFSGEDLARPDERSWVQPGRYAHMAALRNMLLGRVRELEPDLFLSLDSDILLHPLALVDMFDMVAGGFDAASSKAFMTPKGLAAPNYGHFAGYGGMVRVDAVGEQEVDVIMAIKMMTPAAYHIDYEVCDVAEDLTWCAAARAAGLKLGWSGAHASKHLMMPDMLNQEDGRVGF